jgi:hypothetical protein
MLEQLFLSTRIGFMLSSISAKGRIYHGNVGRKEGAGIHVGGK